MTHLGKNQAEFLGRDFRMRMYPGGNHYDQGITDGLLRLHSTYRHDLKIYSSDEGRVQITAAAFAKGLLDLETSNNQLTPILASLVNKDAKLLDFVTHEVEEDILHAKQKLYNIMTEGHVKGRGPNKEYSTSDTAVFDDDFERSGPVGYLRRNSVGDKGSPNQQSHKNSPTEQKPRSYALMSADRARSLKMARKSLSRAASSAMSSLRDAMLTAMSTGITEDKPRSQVSSPLKKTATTAPPTADSLSLAPKKKSADDLVELNRMLVEGTAGNSGRDRTEQGEIEDSTQTQLPPSQTVSPTKSPAKSKAGSPTRASMDDMATTVARLDLEATLNSLTDEEQEYRISLDPSVGAGKGGSDAGNPHLGGSPSAHLPRSSWNATEAKKMLKSRLALGLPETTSSDLRDLSRLKDERPKPESPSGKSKTLSRRTSLDVGSELLIDDLSDSLKPSVEGSITRRPPGVPPEPLKLLRVMVDLIGGVTRQLREEIFKHERERNAAEPDSPGASDGHNPDGSDLLSDGTTLSDGSSSNPNENSPSPETWVETLGALAPRGSIPIGGLSSLKHRSVPAGGESFLLMHARWKKLEQDIYHPRKGRFDISKVPDVYDSAKYDAIHNSHLALAGLEELYRVSRCLAEGVVPNEYGTHPQSKLRIGGTIAHSLLLKLLQDMFTTREESFVGLAPFPLGGGGGGSGGGGSNSNGQQNNDTGGNTSSVSHATDGSDTGDTRQDLDQQQSAPRAMDEEDAAALKEEEEMELSTTRLNHRYANTIGVNSPHRHVRTRLYFTSESHIHSLLNVLRYCNLEAGRKSVNGGGDEAAAAAAAAADGSPRVSASASANAALDATAASVPPSLLSRSVETLENIGDLDYLTHIVFRMYERFDVEAVDPRRFRVEILLSTGVGLDPFKQNVIKEFELAAADANRREKESASPILSKAARRSASGKNGTDGTTTKLPLLRQFPIQNDRAHGGAGEPPAARADKESEKNTEKKYLTLNDLESYLWKFRKNRLNPLGATGGSGGGTSDADKTPTKPPKSGLGGPKRSAKKKKKKGSDSDSE